MTVHARKRPMNNRVDIEVSRGCKMMCSKLSQFIKNDGTVAKTNKGRDEIRRRGTNPQRPIAYLARVNKNKPVVTDR